VASSVTVLIVTAIFFFMADFPSRHFYQKERKIAAEHQVINKETPYYDDIVIKQQGQDLELKENVAYAPVRKSILYHS
jgi:hypothetical protein